MADKTIIVQIKAVVDNISSKLRAVTGDIDKFARSNSVLQRTLGLLDKQQKQNIASMKGMSDGQKSVARGFLGLDQATKTAANRYAKLDDAQRKLGASYKGLSEAVRNGSIKATAAQRQLIQQWQELPSHVKGAVSSYHNLTKANQQLVAGWAGLSTSMRTAVGQFGRLSAPLQAAHRSVLGFSKGLGTAGAATQSFGGKMAGAVKTVAGSALSFNNIARTMTSASRAIGTSMIFAGGSFRQLGVGINVVSSLFGTVIPVIGQLGAGLAKLGPIGIAVTGILATFAVTLAATAVQIGVAGFALFQIAEAGIAFNALMESTQISIATLVTQFKNLFDAQGQQIGQMEQYTDAQLKSMSAEERAQLGRQQSVAINEKLEASLADAKAAFNTLTVEAAQSPFTTQELAKGFQAVVASLGQYNISTKQAAQLTVTLGRVSAVAGVSAANMASQFTLFLTGAGRITSPLSRFAAQVGLSKQKMQELREEFAKAKGDPEKTAAILGVITTRLAAFDEAGRRVAQSWTGIMSNMTEAFELFAGSVTQGLFENIRNSLLNVVPATAGIKDTIANLGSEMVDIFDKDGEKIATKFGEDAKKMASDFNKATDKIPGQFAKVRTKVTGMLSEIFNFDEQGSLPTNIGRTADVFTDKFQPIILIVEDLFTLIGRDIASAISSVTSLVEGAGDSFEETRGEVIRVYEFLKVIGMLIWEFVAGLGQAFGITGDISDSASTLETIIATIAVSLGVVRATLHLIMVVVHTIIGAVKLVGLAVVTTIEAVVEVATFLKDLFTKGISGAFDALTGGFQNTKGVVQSLGKTLASIDSNFKGIGDTAGDIGNIGERMRAVNRGVDADIQKQKVSTADLIKNYQQLAKEGKLYRDGVLIKAVNPKKNYTQSELKQIQENLVGVDEAARVTGVEARRLDRSTRSEIENPVARTTPVGGLDESEEGANGKKRKEAIKQVLQALFEENKSFAEKQIDLERDRVNRQADIIKGLIDIEKSSLDDALESNLVSYSTYFNEIARISELEKNNSIAEIDTETNAITKQHELNVRQQKQEILNAQAKFEQSKQTNVDEAEYYVEIGKLRIKAQTEELEFSNKIEQQEAARQKANQNFVKERIEKIREERDATIEFYTELQKAQFDLSSARGGFDPESIKQQLDSVAASSLDTFRKTTAQLDAAKPVGLLGNLTGKELADTDKLTEYARELRDITIQRVALEFQRIDAATKIAELERAEVIRNRELVELDEQRRLGLINTIEYERRSAEQTAKTVGFLRGQVDTLIDLAARENILNKGVQSEKELELREKIFDVQVRLNEAQNVSETILLRINDELRDASKDFLGTILDDVSNIGDAFTNLGKVIQKTFQKALIDRLFQLPALENIFGSATQTGGRAGGLLSGVGRAQGVDANSAQAANNQAVNFNISERFAEALERNRGAIEQYQEKATTTLEKLSGSLTSIQEFFKSQIDNLTQTITGKTDITVTAATFPNLRLPEPTKPDVLKQGEDGSGKIDPTLKQTSQRRFGGAQAFGGRRNHGGIDWSAVSGTVVGAPDKGKILGLGYDPKSGGFVRILDEATNLVYSYSHLSKIFDVEIKEIAGRSRKNKEATQTTLEELRKLKQETIGTNVSTGTVLGASGNTGDSSGPHIHGSVFRNGKRINPLENETIRRATAPLLGPGGTPFFNPNAGSGLNSKSSAVVEISRMSNEASEQLAGGEKAAEIIDATTRQTEAVTKTTGAVDGLSGTVDTKLGVGLGGELGTLGTDLKSYLTGKFAEVINALTNLNMWKDATLAPNLSAQGKKAGGYISGAGGPTADKIPAWLSNGEYVIKAAAVKKLGLNKLHELNNADKMMPKFGIGGFLGSIFGNIGKFLTSDVGKLVLSTAAPLLIQRLLGEKAGNAMALAMPFIFAGLLKPSAAEKLARDNKTTKALHEAYKNPDNIFGRSGRIVGLPGRASGGPVFKNGAPAFAGGGFFSGLSSVFSGKGGTFKSGSLGSIGSAVGGGAINAALSIGMALLGRLFAKKQPKSDPNRVKDPFGFNPETLTFYKKPIIKGSRNYLASGGPITSNMLLKSMPQFAKNKGFSGLDIEDILRDIGGGDSPINVNQNINITTPDVHSFRQSRGQMERDLARMTQRGIKRRAPKY